MVPRAATREARTKAAALGGAGSNWLLHPAPLFVALALCTCLEATAAADARDPHIPSPEHDGIEAVLNWTRSRLTDAEAEFRATGFERMASPPTWHNEVVYQVVVDRFSNGDLSNDLVNIPEYQKSQLKDGKAYDIHRWRHGGDLQGVIYRLGYIKDVGATAIWLSPILLNDDGSADGYRTSDSTKVDPGFGSNELFRLMVHEAHNMGLRVVLDVVVNHAVSQDFQYAETPSIDKTTACTLAAEDTYWNGTFASSSSWAEENRSRLSWGESLPKYMRKQDWYSRCGGKDNFRPSGIDADSLTPVSTNNTLFEAYNLWPEWFENSFIEFNTMDGDFQEMYTNLLLYWIAYADIDGLRLDAAAHVSADFTAYISTHARHYARSLGKSNFYMIGEVLLPQAFTYLYVGRVPQTQYSAECSAHSGCSGLLGNCCPTDFGMTLSCCLLGGSTPVPQKLRQALERLENTSSQLDPPWPGLPTMYPSPEMSYIRDIARGHDDSTAWWGKEYWARGMKQFVGLLSAQADLQSAWVTVETQDIQRLLSQNGGTQGYESWRLMASLGWSFTWYGIPTIYQGAEMAMNGLCFARAEDLPPGQAELFRGVRGERGTVTWLAKDFDATAGASVLQACNYSTDAHSQYLDVFARQDMFTGGPMRLGSAIPSVQALAGIEPTMMEARGPHWCEEQLLDRSPENRMYQTVKALARIRRSCPVLRLKEVVNTSAGHPEQFAFWKTNATDITLGILHYVSHCTECGLSLCDPSLWSKDANFVESGYQIGPSLWRWGCDKVMGDNVQVIRNSETGFLYVLEQVERAQALAPESPQLALVVLTFSPSVSWNVSRFPLPPSTGFRYGKDAIFVDLLTPSRKATVVEASASDSRLLLEVPEVEGSNVAIFVPEEHSRSDGDAPWLVCGGSDLPPAESPRECQASPLWITWLALIGCVLLIGGVLVANCSNGIFLCVIQEPSPVEPPANPTRLPSEVDADWPRHIFVAAIEHTIPERKVKVSAGGLGKVLDQMLREHPPGLLSLVHPKIGGVDYGEMERFTEIRAHVDLEVQTVTVYRIKGAREGGIFLHWYILEHKWFSELTKAAPYPYPMTKLSVLRFFSLWNQAAAGLMAELEPDVYHCMDYHAALVPLYVPQDKLIPTIIVLHNADYDGAVETEFIADVFWNQTMALKRLSLIFNLDLGSIRHYCSFEGRFNMLQGGIASAMELQKGHGVCTVSGIYAAELGRERTMFKGLPTVLPLDNAIDSAADDGPKTVGELQTLRMRCKRELQEYCGLAVDPNAKILIFVGRWVKQKGVDHIALLAPGILSKHPEVQFVLAGPPGDPYGNYAQELLAPLVQTYPGRLFVKTEFFMIPKDARAGAHLCLMPSCSEPFGYVDVEFGLLGVPSLGCAIGGLGKMPGVYFRQQNSDAGEMLIEGFKQSVEYALSMPDQEYWEMALAATTAQFPFSVWRENLQECYRVALSNFDRDDRDERGTGPQTLDEEAGVGNLVTGKRTGKDKKRWLRVASGGSDGKSGDGLRVAQQLERMKVMEAKEFLLQPVSEERVKEIMRGWMLDEHGKDTDAETLQSHISLEDQKMNERNYITRWLMRPCPCCTCCLDDKCLRIHVVIALGYIVSPFMDKRLTLLRNNAASSVENYSGTLVLLLVNGLGGALGSVIWLYLSKHIPANLLMALSFFYMLIFSFVTINQTFTDVWGYLVIFVGGLLAASRLLFLIWNFNEDFHGGFQVGTKRVALVESLRTAVAQCIAATTLWTRHSEPAQNWPFVMAVLVLTVLVMLAPSCYSSYVLPTTNFFKQLDNHKVYLLLTASLALNELASFAGSNTQLWLSLNGWHYNEIGFISVGAGVAIVIFLFVIFISLHRMSVWGPWPMRGIVCLVPPGSLLRTLAWWDLGPLHYRSPTFLMVIIASEVLDATRNAAIWTAMLTTLSNKWYAIIGGFLCIFVCQICTGVSPFVTDILGRLFSGHSPVFSRFVPNHPEVNPENLQQATMAAVWPLALIAWGLQIYAGRFFLMEVLTYKGHGNQMPDGSQPWPESRTVCVGSPSRGKKSRRKSKEAEDTGGSGTESDSASSDEGSS